MAEPDRTRQGSGTYGCRRCRQKLLIIGVDAGSPELFHRWVDSGDLPNLARLLRYGQERSVRNPYALEAGSVWPVFHTGLTPGRQPQYDGRRVFEPSDYSVRWYEQQETPPSFWRQLSDQGVRCLLIDPPYTLLDPQINGSMIVDWGTHVPANGRRFQFQTHPPELAGEVLGLVGGDPADGIICDRMGPETIADHRRFRDIYLQRIAGKGRLAVHMLTRQAWDLALVVSSDLHCTGHHLWHVNDPAHPRYSPRLQAALGNPLKDCYRAFDASLGDVVDAVGDDTTVMVFASHGMGPSYSGTGLLDRILACLDAARPASSSRSLRGHARHFWHRLPVEWRGRLKPLRRHLRGRLRPPRFVGDFQSRRFFEVYANNATGGVRLNLRGREGGGIVAPSQADTLLRHLVAELGRVINAETGEPLVEEVIVTRDRYDGLYTDRLPDLLVRWNRRAPIRSVTSPAIGTLNHESSDNRTGDHTPQGMCLLWGRGVAKSGQGPEISTQDIAPSVAGFFGHELADHDGRAFPILSPTVEALT